MSGRRHPVLQSRPDVAIEGSERVWDGRYPLDVVRFRHRRFDGAMSGLRTWELWRRGAAVAVLPYDPESDRVVLMEQFRLPALGAGIDPVMVEIPAGFIEPSEHEEAAVRREAAEEIGLTIGQIEPAGHFMLTPGGCDERIGIYAGRVRAPEARPDGIAGFGGLASENEDIRVRVWPALVAIDAALSGRVPNSVAALALLWFAARREWLRATWLDQAGENP